MSVEAVASAQATLNDSAIARASLHGRRGRLAQELSAAERVVATEHRGRVALELADRRAAVLAAAEKVDAALVALIAAATAHAQARYDLGRVAEAAGLPVAESLRRSTPAQLATGAEDCGIVVSYVIRELRQAFPGEPCETKHGRYLPNGLLGAERTELAAVLDLPPSGTYEEKIGYSGPVGGSERWRP